MVKPGDKCVTTTSRSLHFMYSSGVITKRNINRIFNNSYEGVKKGDQLILPNCNDVTSSGRVTHTHTRGNWNGHLPSLKIKE